MNEDDLCASLKLWTHEMIDRGATLEQLGATFLALAAGFFQNESAEAFAARAGAAHELTEQTAS